MLGNDISNRTAPIICFNIDNLLFTGESKDDGLIINMIRKLGLETERSNYLDRKIDQKVVNIINNIWTRYDFSIYLTTRYYFLEDIDEVLQENDVYHTRLFTYPSIDILSEKIKYEYSLYVDSDPAMISMLNSGRAIHISELPNHMKVTRR